MRFVGSAILCTNLLIPLSLLNSFEPQAECLHGQRGCPAVHENFLQTETPDVIYIDYMGETDDAT
jgi:hypothetical protein